MTECPADEVWTALLAGQLSTADEAALYKHCTDCLDCQRIFAALGDTAEGPDQEPSPPLLPAGGAAPFAAWAPPKVFAEFHIRKPLGHGAMGQVYVAHDMMLDRPVAVKFITSLGRLEKERFLVEARAIARLNHPNVVTLYRAGELDGRPYLVSELVPGASLDHLEIPIPWQRALELGRDLAAGLAEAHRCGVVHRDVKPANVILSKSGVVKLLDFGLARLSQPPVGDLQKPSAAPAQPMALTQPGAMLGTPLYMSPEAWLGKEPSPQMDVYSLGALLYELCTGVPPHVANERLTLGWKALHEDVVALVTKAPGVDLELAKVVDRCLQRDPAARFPSGVELHQALQAVTAGAANSGPPSEAPTLLFSRDRVRPAASELPAATPGPAAPPLVGQQRRRQYLFGLLLGLSLLLSVPLLWLWKQADGPQDMVLLAGGEFTMGSSPKEIVENRAFCEHTVGADCKPEFFQREPQRQVRVSPFYLDVTEVTNEKFAEWLDRLPGKKITYARLVDDAQSVRLADLYPSQSNGLHVQDGRIKPIAGHERMPVVQVSWEAALRYCQDHGKQLPTEAQWEFAARGPQGHRFPWGDGEPRCDGVAFGRDPGQQCASLSPGPGPVGSAEQDRSPQGIHDLGGSVSEWVMDLFRTPYPTCRTACENPLVTIPLLNEKVTRVVRGGNWGLPGEACRAAGRTRWSPQQPTGNTGFRCAQSAK